MTSGHIRIGGEDQIPRRLCAHHDGYTRDAVADLAVDRAWKTIRREG